MNTELRALYDIARATRWRQKKYFELRRNGTEQEIQQALVDSKQAGKTLDAAIVRLDRLFAAVDHVDHGG